jgi:uncharacterized membrane protein YjjB (DUF3815 family)
MELLRAIVFDAFWSAIPAVGFAMIFAVPPRMLKYCAAGGALAHSFRMLQIHFGMPIEWATFITTTLIGLIFVYVSRRLLAPRPVFTVASIIPMIPGEKSAKVIDKNGKQHTVRRDTLLDVPQHILYPNIPVVVPKVYDEESMRKAFYYD